MVYRLNADWTELRELVGLGSGEEAAAFPDSDWRDVHLHPADRAEVERAIEHGIASKHMLELEHRVRLRDGS